MLTRIKSSALTSFSLQLSGAPNSRDPRQEGRDNDKGKKQGLDKAEEWEGWKIKQNNLLCLDEYLFSDGFFFLNLYILSLSALPVPMTTWSHQCGIISSPCDMEQYWEYDHNKTAEWGPWKRAGEGARGAVCVIVSTAFLTSGPKPHRPPRFKTMRVQTRASDMGWGRRGPGGSTDHLKGIQILFYGCWPFIKCDRQSMDAWVRLWGKRNVCAG